MRYLLQFLTILPLKILVFIWNLEWWSNQKMKEELKKPIPSYFVGAIQFGVISTLITITILKSYE